MKSPVKRLSIIIGVILLPLLLYTFFEVTTLNENEQILSEIYNEQLDAIAMGVNQYAEGVVKNWMMEIKGTLNQSSGEGCDTDLVDLIGGNPALELIVFVDTNNIANYKFYSSFGKQWSKTAASRINTILEHNAIKIKQLREYYNAGYSKIEWLENKIDSSPLYAFFINNKNFNQNLILIAVDDQKFIKMFLTKKISPLVREEFSINIDKKENLENERNIGGINLVQKKYDLWLLPNYYLGISVNGKTIEEFVGDRITLNITLILLLNLVIILGLVYVFLNAKKEIELSQMKTDFVANVSHEIRTPLSLISMFAETLELGRVNSEEKKQEYYSIIRRESERLGNIVNQILNFSQMEAQKKKFTFKSVNLNILLEEIMDTYQFHLIDKNVDYEIDLDSDLPIIELDKGAVSEAIINIIDNAVKYSRDEKKIVIKTFKRSGNAVLEIKDNGIGIAKENLNKVFDKFFRSSSTLVHDTKGNGLGLTLVKHIMDVHKGKVSVESKLGKGSTFILEFPVTIS